MAGGDVFYCRPVNAAYTFGNNSGKMTAAFNIAQTLESVINDGYDAADVLLIDGACAHIL